MYHGKRRTKCRSSKKDGIGRDGRPVGTAAVCTAVRSRGHIERRCAEGEEEVPTLRISKRVAV